MAQRGGSPLSIFGPRTAITVSFTESTMGKLHETWHVFKLPALSDPWMNGHLHISSILQHSDG